MTTSAPNSVIASCVEHGFVSRPVGALCHREILVEPLPRSSTAFVGVALKVGVLDRRVNVQRYRHDVGAFPKYRLSSVAGMGVDVKGRDASAGIGHQLSCYGGVVEVTVAAVGFGPGVMTRGSD